MAALPLTSASKPVACRQCPLQFTGYGFLADKPAPKAKIAVLWSAPAEESVIYGDVGAGGVERVWVRHCLTMQGYQRSDVLFSHCLRCSQPRTKDGYPIPTVAKPAQQVCRQYDIALRAWNPNAFIVTYGIDAALEAVTLTQMQRRDVRKAFELCEEGYRPLLLCGEHAAKMVYPQYFAQGAGGMKQWRGHWHQGRWPF